MLRLYFFHDCAILLLTPKYVVLRFTKQAKLLQKMYSFLIISVALKQKKCISKPTVRVAALVIGIALAGIAILSAYAAGMFDSGPDLPETMEGEATFTTDDGKGEVFHVVIDYKRNLIQLTSLGNLVSSSPLSGRRLMSVEENKTANASEINATKIVIQDYNTVSSMVTYNFHLLMLLSCLSVTRLSSGERPNVLSILPWY